MRLVIDLTARTGIDSRARHEALELADRLASRANGHEVWLAIDDRLGGAANSVEGRLPEGRIVRYRMPEALDSDSSWLRQAAEEIRAAFLASLNPDVVFESVPSGTLGETCPEPRPYAVAGIVPAGSRVCEAAARRSSLLVTLTEEDRQAAIDSLGRESHRVVAIPLGEEPPWAALEALSRRRAPVPGRPRLACCSPRDPGIALIRELGAHYEIELIADRCSEEDSWLRANFPVRTVAWFETHAGEYDRILYVLGDSRAHEVLLDLIPRHPGVVVLQDFFLGRLLAPMDRDGRRPGLLSRELYRSHGFKALAELKASGWDAVSAGYPASKSMLDAAAGVVVHSEHALELARAWYGPAYPARWRKVPMARSPAGGQERRQAARALLGLGPDEHLVCSFGALGETKLNDRLLEAWLASPLAADERCRLVYVGREADGAAGRELSRRIAASDSAHRIRITGRVYGELYATYLAAADCAVQLRTRGRAETPSALLDCFAHGVPTIVNAHGSHAEVPEDAALRLSDDFAPSALTDALTRLWRDRGLRDRLRSRAVEHVRAAHDPARSANELRGAIEAFAASSPRLHYARAIRSLARIGASPVAGDLEQAALALAANQPPLPPRQLLVDVSGVVQGDARTGIQRVARSILLALVDDPPAGLRVEPVYCRGPEKPFRYARRYMLDRIGLGVAGLEDDPVELGAGDVFLGLDLLLAGGYVTERRLRALRDRGVRTCFVVYDMLPELRPDCFVPAVVEQFHSWLRVLAGEADAVVCISRAVAVEVRAWLEANPHRRSRPLHVTHFHLGADIDASGPSAGLPPESGSVFAAVRSRPSLLMVGTVEPRKGHAQALAAFEGLWAQGVDANLVIVGNQGWMVGELAARLRAHPEKGKRLFWLPAASDQMLLELYEACSGLLMASEGEGFGLPLIEAAKHHLPVLARRLPVFEEIAGEHAAWFEGLEPRALQSAIGDWLRAFAAGAVPLPTGIAWLTWARSSRQLVKAMEPLLRPREAGVIECRA